VRSTRSAEHGGSLTSEEHEERSMQEMRGELDELGARVRSMKELMRGSLTSEEHEEHEVDEGGV
jgi:hypothetical protein